MCISFVYIPNFPHVRHISFIILDLFILLYIWWRYILKFLIMLHFPSSCYFLRLCSRYFPQHHIFTPSIRVRLLGWGSKFHAHKKAINSRLIFRVSVRRQEDKRVWPTKIWYVFSYMSIGLYTEQFVQYGRCNSLDLHFRGARQNLSPDTGYLTEVFLVFLRLPRQIQGYYIE
jgi:hypothetical protein